MPIRCTNSITVGSEIFRQVQPQLEAAWEPWGNALAMKRKDQLVLVRKAVGLIGSQIPPNYSTSLVDIF